MKFEISAAASVRCARKLILTLAASGILVGSVPSAIAQNAQTPRNTIPDAGVNAANNEAPEKHTWTIPQLLPLTVAQAWQLSGRNEDRFFDMVQDLAAFSARNRNLVLPQSEAAGRQTGEYIKQQAKADHEQLLYEIVDRAVRKVGTPAPATGK